MGDLFICSSSEKPIFASFTRCTFPTNTFLLISLDFRVGYHASVQLFLALRLSVARDG